MPNNNFVFDDTYAPTSTPTPKPASVPKAKPASVLSTPKATVVPKAKQEQEQQDFVFDDTYAPRSLATVASQQTPVAQAAVEPQAPQPSIYEDVLRRTVGAGNALVKGITFGASDEIVSEQSTCSLYSTNNLV